MVHVYGIQVHVSARKVMMTYCCDVVFKTDFVKCYQIIISVIFDI